MHTAGPEGGRAPRIVGSSRWMEPEERLDLIVHAAMQGPVGTRVLLVGGPGPDRRRLELLAGSGGVDLTFAPEYGPEEGDVHVLTSPRNARAGVITADDVPAAFRLARWPNPPGAGERTFASLVERLYQEADPGSPPPGGGIGALRGHRVLVIANIPTHYRIPLFDRVSARIEAEGGRFTVAFLGDPYARRSWMVPGSGSFESIAVRSIGLPLTREWHPFVPAGLGRHLERHGPTVVVTAGFSPAVSGVAARYAARRRIPLGIWSGETALTRGGGQGWRRILRRWLLGRADFALAYGHAAGEYLRSYTPGLPVTYVRNTTPVPTTSQGSPATGPVRILTVADMSSARKGVDLLIDALAGLASLPWSLTVVGGGPHLAAVRERAAPLGDRVRFTGALQSNRVADAYGAADVFALASRTELFGLVLVEAMGAGLATLASDRTGATADLCVDGGNALIVSPNAVEPWRGALRRVIEDAELRARLGRAGRATIARRWSMDHSAAAFVAGLRLGVMSAAAR